MAAFIHHFEWLSEPPLRLNLPKRFARTSFLLVLRTLARFGKIEVPDSVICRSRVPDSSL